MAGAPAVARIADDGSGISQPVRMGTTPEAFQHPHSREPRAEEKLRLKIGQGGLVDDEGAGGPGTKPAEGAPTRAVASASRPALEEAADAPEATDTPGAGTQDEGAGE
jgi:hypothetical protein